VNGQPLLAFGFENYTAFDWESDRNTPPFRNELSDFLSMSRGGNNRYVIKHTIINLALTRQPVESVMFALDFVTMNAPVDYSEVNPDYALAKTELHFDINACQQIEPGLYKCPASDKAICNPDYNGQAECVRIGPKGSVFVKSGFAN